MPDVQETIVRSCSHLELTAQAMQIRLCRDLDAVPQLENLLRGLVAFPVDKQTMSGATFLVGAYLGEILRKQVGGVWATSSSGDLSLTINGVVYHPVETARKFAENISTGDELTFFVQAVLAEASSR